MRVLCVYENTQQAPQSLGQYWVVCVCVHVCVCVRVRVFVGERQRVCVYRVAKMHRMSSLDMSFSAKELYN